MTRRPLQMLFYRLWLQLCISKNSTVPKRTKRKENDNNNRKTLSANWISCILYWRSQISWNKSQYPESVKSQIKQPDSQLIWFNSTCDRYFFYNIRKGMPFHMICKMYSWFETPSPSLWRHWNEYTVFYLTLCCQPRVLINKRSVYMARSAPSKTGMS